MMKFHNIFAAAAVLASLSLSSSAAIYPSPAFPAADGARPAADDPETPAAPSRRDTIKVLAIGNSFSTDALHDHLHEIAAADGQPMVVGNMYIGGCTLERHWDCASHDKPSYRYGKQGADGVRESRPGTTLLQGIVDEDWDYITIQQGGGMYGIQDSYEPYLSQLREYVLAHATNPDVKLAMQQIWPLPLDGVTSRFCRSFYGTPKEMYAANVAAARHFQEAGGFDLVIPTGTAIQNLRVTYVADNVYRDAHHLGYTVGRYTAALTWYGALTGHDVTANTYEPPYIQPARRELVQKCVEAALRCPDKVTGDIAPEGPVLCLEEQVPAYTLPDPLMTASGEMVKSVREWEDVRRPELLELFTGEMFGRAPQPSPEQHYKVLYEDRNALGGLATRKEVNVYFTEGEDAYLTLMIYVPNGVEGPVPTFLGVNFKGNWGVSGEEGIIMPSLNGNKRHQVLENVERGAAADRWPLEMILKAGYGVATYYRGDTCPDIDSDFNTPLHRAFNPGGRWKHPENDEWGCIAAWAWGLSRCLDYLETDASVDASRVAVIGHSRLGKTALWAGATDPRFAMVISNCSGSCGAAISRRHFGETLEALNNRFPHWFCDNYDRYNTAENELPFDQHELLALIAPRPLYVASATLDGWADPHGEFISACEASRVYNLYGVKGLVGTDGREVTATARKVAGAVSCRSVGAGREVAGFGLADTSRNAAGQKVVGAGRGSAGAGREVAGLGHADTSRNAAGQKVAGAGRGSVGAGTGWSRRAAGRLIKAAASANARAGRIVSGSTLTDNPADLSRNVALLDAPSSRMAASPGRDVVLPAIASGRASGSVTGTAPAAPASAAPASASAGATVTGTPSAVSSASAGATVTGTASAVSSASGGATVTGTASAVSSASAGATVTSGSRASATFHSSASCDSRATAATSAEKEIEALKYAAMPEPGQPLLQGTVAYHIHTGPHAITAYDWQQYILFADRFLK